MASAAARWREALAEWAIPKEIIDRAPESPWHFPVKLFALPLTAKLSAQNLLDSKYLFTQAGNIYYRYNRGTTVSVGLSYTY